MAHDSPPRAFETFDRIHSNGSIALENGLETVAFAAVALRISNGDSLLDKGVGESITLWHIEMKNNHFSRETSWTTGQASSKKERSRRQ